MFRVHYFRVRCFGFSVWGLAWVFVGLRRHIWPLARSSGGCRTNDERRARALPGRPLLGVWGFRGLGFRGLGVRVLGVYGFMG